MVPTSPVRVIHPVYIADSPADIFQHPATRTGALLSGGETIRHSLPCRSFNHKR